MRKTIRFTLATIVLLLPIGSVAAGPQADVAALCNAAARIAESPSSAVTSRFASVLDDLAPLCGFRNATTSVRPNPVYPFTVPRPPRTRIIPTCPDGEAPIGVVCGNAVPVGCTWECSENGIWQRFP